MKKILYLLALLLLSINTFSQVNMDSLWGVWNDRFLEDSTRINALVQISEKLLYSSADSANLLADTILSLSVNKNLKRFQATALRIKGQYYQNQKAFAQAMENFEKSMAISEEIQYKIEMAYVNYGIGLNYRGQYDYLRAHEYFLKGVTISEGIGDKISLAKGYTHIGRNYYDQGDFSQNALVNYKKASDLYEEMGNQGELAFMKSRTGGIYFYQGNYPKALLVFKEYLDFGLQIGDSKMLSKGYNNIGAIYQIQKEYDKAIDYYERAAVLNEEMGDQRGIAIILFNIGECHQEQGNFSRSLEYFQRCIFISKENNGRDLIADCNRGIGLIYFDKKEYSAASKYFQLSLEGAQEIGYMSIIGANYTSLGVVSEKLFEYRKAIDLCSKGLDLSQRMGALKQQVLASNCLYKSYKSIGNIEKALVHHELFLTLSDSLQNEETAKQLQQMEFDRQMLEDSVKQEEAKLLAKLESQQQISDEKIRKNLFMYSGIVILILAISLYRRMSHIRRSRTIIQAEKDKSDTLLLNILPSEVADELKEKGESVAKDFEDVSVLFTDFKGFTTISESLTAQELVAEINTCFKAFDSIITSYGMEKIKTIGDSYMAAGGLHTPRTSTTKDVVMAGLEMQNFMKERKAELESRGELSFEMRVGIHTGPVVAGIVGVKKFQYDIWGDTVNIASRMESSGEVGAVNISETTYNLVKEEDLLFEHRGKIEAKNKGKVEMYFVKKAS